MGITIKASAPGRCGILGNPSDIYGGTVLSCSIPARNSCTLHLDQPFESLDDSRLWDAATRRFPMENVRVEWHSEVPRSSGLSGSTAMLAATLACVIKARQEPIDLETHEGKTTFAELVRDVERNEGGVVCGFQDAYMISHGGLQLMEFPGKHPVNAGPFGRLKNVDAPLPFLLITTGVERLSGSVHGPVIERWINGDDEVIDAMKFLPSLARLGARCLANGDYAEVGKMMDENHRVVASLGGSGDDIDLLISHAKRHGAMGAKLAGAGMGGTVIALTINPDELELRLREEGYAKFMRPTSSEGVRFEPAQA